MSPRQSIRALASRAWHPPDFHAQPRWLQAIDAFVVPVTWGFTCGLVVGLSELAFFACCAVALAGGISAGLQHHRTAAALTRGLIGSTLFGATILAGHATAGSAPTHAIPDPALLQLPVSIVPGLLLALIGCSIRGRRETASRY